MEIARSRADGRPLRIAESVLNLLDDRVLVDTVRDSLAELRVPEPLPLPRCEIGLAGVRVTAGVHVECQERCPESGTASVDREVSFLLQRFEDHEFLAQDAMDIRLSAWNLMSSASRSGTISYLILSRYGRPLPASSLSQ